MSGTLYIVGGGMNRNAKRIFTALINSAGGPDARFAFVVSASGEGPDETFRAYVEDFTELGVPAENCVLIPLYGKDVRDERGYNALTGDADGLEELLRGVTGVWFTGGDQYYTSKCFLREDGTDTKLLTLMKQMYQNGGVIGGSSAGAAIMSRVMIGEGTNRGVMRYGVRHGYKCYDPDFESDEMACSPLLITNEGLGFFPLGIVDQHFNMRPRLIRSVETCFSNTMGVRRAFGVSEDTALVYREGRVEVLGGAGVFVMECENAVKRGDGSYENVALSVLCEGDAMDADGTISIAAKDKDEPYYFTRDYIAGGVTECAQFDDCMDKLLHGSKNSLSFDGEGRAYVRSSVLYDAGDREYLLRLRYTKTQNTFGALREDGHISLARVRLDTKAVEL